MYESFSNDYDRFVNWDNRLAGEMPFLEGMLNGMGQNGDLPRVLDAACGTGMHAVALAKLGFQMTGADLSGGMIERARANAAEAGEAVRFKTAGFGHTRPLAQYFDAILCLGNTLPHLLPKRKNRVRWKILPPPAARWLMLILNRNLRRGVGQPGR